MCVRRDSLICMCMCVHVCKTRPVISLRLTSVYMCVRRDSLICLPPLLHTCTHIHMCVHVCKTRRLIHVCAMIPFRLTGLIHTCDMTHSHVWHDSLIHVTCLIHMCDMTHSYVWHDSSSALTCRKTSNNHAAPSSRTRCAHGSGATLHTSGVCVRVCGCGCFAASASASASVCVSSVCVCLCVCLCVCGPFI